jgi:hypothetical protein
MRADHDINYAFFCLLYTLSHGPLPLPQRVLYQKYYFFLVPE